MVDLGTIKRKIVSKRSKVGIWGCGLVGTTNLLYLSAAGFDCVAYDINAERLDEIRNGKFDKFSTIDVWEKLYNNSQSQKISVTHDFNDMLDEDIHIHIICVPTERNGTHYNKPLEDVAKKLASRKRKSPIVIIIESTIVPSWIDNIMAKELYKQGFELDKDFFMGTAPRRDLFGDKGFSLTDTARVIGGCSPASNELLLCFYNTFCNDVHLAIDASHAMLSKIVENLFRYQSITLANQLMASFPDYDITHVLSLSGTKWNMETYHPSLGIGGYCVPLAPKYLQEEVRWAEHHRIFPPLIESAISYNQDYVSSLIPEISTYLNGCIKVAILGVSYIANLGIAQGSIAYAWEAALRGQGYEVGIHDPLIPRSQIELQFPHSRVLPDLECLNGYDAVILLVEHEQYVSIKDVSNMLRPGTRIIDNFGIWRTAVTDYFTYYEIGSRTRRLNKLITV